MQLPFMYVAHTELKKRHFWKVKLCGDHMPPPLEAAEQLFKHLTLAKVH